MGDHLNPEFFLLHLESERFFSGCDNVRLVAHILLLHNNVLRRELIELTATPVLLDLGADLLIHLLPLCEFPDVVKPQQDQASKNPMYLHFRPKFLLTPFCFRSPSRAILSCPLFFHSLPVVVSSTILSCLVVRIALSVLALRPTTLVIISV